MEPIIVDDVSKVFKVRQGLKEKSLSGLYTYLFRKRKVTALDDVSFKVSKGDIFGLIGPNGAGKTTITRIISTLLLPTKGIALVNGFDVCRESENVQKSIGVVIGEQSRALYWRLSGKENLEFYSKLYEMPKEEAEKRISELLELVDLKEKADDYVMHYSSGMKNRLGIARALLHNPEILMIDDITEGLDPKSALNIRNIVKHLTHKGKTIFLTSHNMDEVEHLCDKVAMLNKGKIIAIGTPEELKKKVVKDKVVKMFLDRHIPHLGKKLEQRKDILHAREFGNNLVVHVPKNSDVGKITALIEKEHAKILEVTTVKPSMEDVFLRLLGKEKK